MLVPEMELTMRVAVYSAAGYTRPQIIERLGSSELEIKMALERLKRIAKEW